MTYQLSRKKTNQSKIMLLHAHFVLKMVRKILDMIIEMKKT